jgi:gamma-glutamyl hercynylcysteine S-oxide synthase
LAAHGSSLTSAAPGTDELDAARARTLALVAHLSREELERVLDPLMSPLVWDLAHIAAYEDLWICHRLGGLPMLHPELAAMYDAFETPRAVRGDLPLLDTPGAVAYLDDVRARSVGVLGRVDAGDRAQTDLVELVLRHELQHTETMRQAMRLGGVLPAGEPPAHGDWLRPGRAGWAEVAAGPAELGAAGDGFAYDNERPRHRVELPAFEIARRPVTNATWLRFAEGGGYVRREWWSDEGWAWKEEYDITGWAGSASVAAAPPDAPVSHVSWFEADAFARSREARLPTEAEWEKASTSNQLDVAGHVWEWTSSQFGGYPGFVAHPYPEYSEVFFGPDYRVLRGGSWATHPRVASPAFRNWDLPQRRQLFAGLRLARDPKVPA